MIIIIKRVFEKKGDISGKIVIAAFFFLAAALYSSIRSFSPIRAIQEVIDGYAMPFLVFYIGVYLFRRKMEIGKLSWLFIVLGLYVSLLGIIEFISSYDFFPSPVGLRMTSYYLRSNGPFYTSEAYAMFLSLCFFIWRYIKQNKKEPWSKIEKTGLIIIFIGILCSMLRTILIAFMAAYFFPFIYDRKKLIRHLFYFAGIAVLIVALFPFIAKSPIYQQRIADYQNVATRFSAYYTSIAIIKDHVIQGIGLLNFSEFSKMNKYSISFRGYSHPSSAHNVILSILAEMGLLGFIPFCAIIYWIISSFIIVSRFNLSKNMGLISVLIVYLLPSLSLNLSMSAPNNYLFFFFLSSLYVQRINNLDYNKDT